MQKNFKYLVEWRTHRIVTIIGGLTFALLLPVTPTMEAAAVRDVYEQKEKYSTRATLLRVCSAGAELVLASSVLRNFSIELLLKFCDDGGALSYRVGE